MDNRDNIKNRVLELFNNDYKDRILENMKTIGTPNNIKTTRIPFICEEVMDYAIYNHRTNKIEYLIIYIENDGVAESLVLPLD